MEVTAEEVIVLQAETQQGSQLHEWERPRILNLERKSSEHLRWTHWSRYSIALTYPARSHFQRTLSKEDGSRAGMNVSAYQEKKKTEETKTGMKKAEEGRRHGTDFKKAVRCPSAVVQEAARQKMVPRECPG